MYRHPLSAFLVAIVVLLSTAVRAGNGVSGTIVGSVFDGGGNALPGVRVSARSDTQIGGPKNVVTNGDGNFRIVGLVPGTFEVTASGPGLGTVLHRAVRVGVDAPAEVTVVMEVENAAVDEVKIVERPPVVSTTTATVREVYDEDFVDNLPAEWKVAVEDFVGRNTSGAYYINTRALRIRGGGENQNQFNVEGFYMNGQRVTMKSLSA